ncbi:MAG: ABC transporter permease [Sphingomonadales bacterium]
MIKKSCKHLSILLVSFACLFPFILLLFFSLTNKWPFPEILPFGFETSNWEEMVFGTRGLYWNTALSAIIATPVAVFSTALGFITARVISISPKGDMLLFISYLPFALSPVVLSLSLLYLFLKLNMVGTVSGVMLAQLMSSFAFATIFFTTFWNIKARALEELVYTLGGTTWQAFRKVIIPGLKGPILLCFFQTFLISWFQYGLPLVIGAGKVQTLPVKVFVFLGEASPHYAAMASVLLILPPTLLLWFNRELLIGESDYVA